MTFKTSIVQEKAKLVKAVIGNKLGQKITKGILLPILEQIEEDYEEVMTDAAQFAQGRIIDYLHSSTPSGRTYKIVAWEPGVGSRIIGTYTASAKGQPPASISGQVKGTPTLLNAIDYEIDSDGSFRVGLLKEYGEMSDAGTEFESVAFRFGKILVNPNLETNRKTPVGTYGRALEGGFTNKATNTQVQRPWFEKMMNEIREELRQRIRKNIRKSLNKATRRISVRRAIVFKVYFT